jgi:hypothetical protein
MDDRSSASTTTAIAGVHYVCAADGLRMRLLVGPFTTAAEAQHWVGPAQDVLLWQGELEVAVETGVSRLLTRAGLARPGDLNHQLGLPVTS